MYVYFYIRNLKYTHLTEFSILYLTTQIQMDIVYRKTGFQHEFLRLLMYKNLQSPDLFLKNDKFVFKTRTRNL